MCYILKNDMSNAPWTSALVYVSFSFNYAIKETTKELNDIYNPGG